MSWLEADHCSPDALRVSESYVDSRKHGKAPMDTAESP